VGANVYAGQTTSFAVDARDVGCKKVDVEVLDPSGKPIDAEISQEQPISVSYTPSKAGPHKVRCLKRESFSKENKIQLDRGPGMFFGKNLKRWNGTRCLADLFELYPACLS
jgi:hypothetical protein